jgi:hypothetical protein
MTPSTAPPPLIDEFIEAKIKVLVSRMVGWRTKYKHPR